MVLYKISKNAKVEFSNDAQIRRNQRSQITSAKKQHITFKKSKYVRTQIMFDYNKNLRQAKNEVKLQNSQNQTLAVIQ